MQEAQLLAIESYLGADCGFLSGRYWDSEETFSGDNNFLTSSYEPILKNLEQECPVLLNMQVTKVSIKNNQVFVSTGSETFLADAVLVTVPLGILKNSDITFAPPLPESKLAAIKKLAMGVFNITAFKFPKSFWPKENHAMFLTGRDDESIPVFFNLHHYIKQPVIVGFSGGDRARRLESFSDADLIDKTIDNFKKIYGAEIPKPDLIINTSWSQDPFSRGSYSYIPTGASTNDYDEIALPVMDKIFFAGEATCSQYPATTHGAYLSGVREAHRIVRTYS